MNRCILSPTALAKLVEYGKLELKFSIEDWLEIALSHPNLQTIDLTIPKPDFFGKALVSCRS
jgi:hypothetical protein